MLLQKCKHPNLLSPIELDGVTPLVADSTPANSTTDTDTQFLYDIQEGFDKTLKLTATRYFGTEPQDQGCHSETNLIRN